MGAPALAVALGALELALVRLAGPPGRQLEVLRQLGQVGADPLASVLALLAVAAEGLAAYLLAVLGLRLLASLPGVVGRLASGVTLLVTPASVRRALDLPLGGALLAQVTFVPLPTRARATAAPVAAGPAQTTATPLSTAPAATPGRRAAGWLGRDPVGTGRWRRRRCRRGWWDGHRRQGAAGRWVRRKPPAAADRRARTRQAAGDRRR